MGTEALWIPLVLAAAGAGADAYNNRQIGKETDRLAAQGIRKQGMRQQEVDARVNEELNAQSRSTPEGERAAALDAYTAQLQRGRASAESGLTGIAGASDRYQTDVNAGKSAIGNYGDLLAGIQSRIDAPQRQRENEGVSRSRTAGDIGRISRDAQADDYLNQLLQSSVKGSTALEIAGPMLRGASQATAAGMGRTPSSAEFARMHAPSQQAVSSMFRGARRLPVTI